ncbi:hypothetical protein Bpfe_004392 [Biomphalaria pfeifferi]|uniref:Uncharacterized protein n=1 Tax=Biomphalaria pfeifferi TaxID=112525 RepID=A0AAD8C4J2_BIOPF|nr:hypothetical protein Bpfe_004392 [Biomphalaria pfeifferi]
MYNKIPQLMSLPYSGVDMTEEAKNKNCNVQSVPGQYRQKPVTGQGSQKPVPKGGGQKVPHDASCLGPNYFCRETYMQQFVLPISEVNIHQRSSPNTTE